MKVRIRFSSTEKKLIQLPAPQTNSCLQGFVLISPSLKNISEKTIEKKILKDLFRIQ